MHIKIETEMNEYYYINFNKASNYNFLTQEGADQVVITTAGNENDTDVIESSLQSKSRSGKSWSVTTGTETGPVKVKLIRTSVGPHNHGY